MIFSYPPDNTTCLQPVSVTTAVPGSGVSNVGEVP